MITDTRFQIGPVVVSTSAATVYFSVPKRCVLRSVRALPQATLAVGASTAITVAAGSTSLGAIAFAKDASSNAAAGVAGTYTPDASSGSTVLAANTVVTITAASMAQDFILDIETDPYARSL